MAIYSKPVRELIPQMVDALAPEPGKVFTRTAAIDWFRQNVDGEQVEPGQAIEDPGVGAVAARHGELLQ